MLTGKQSCTDMENGEVLIAYENFQKLRKDYDERSAIIHEGSDGNLTVKQAEIEARKDVIYCLDRRVDRNNKLLLKETV